MKRAFSLLLFASMLVSGCVLPSFAVPTATATEIILPTETPTAENTATPSNTPTETATPTETPLPSETPEPSDTPTFTPTATELPFDPGTEYGSSTLFDAMNDDRNWADASGALPDNDFIRLGLGGGELHVTGKLASFDTWWFTSPSPSDFFLQVKVDSGDCSDKQAYGLISRGPASAGAAARGYIFTFACDGSYRLDRLDSTSPYTKVELIGWTESDYINNGPQEENLLGLRMIGDTITMYANGFKIDEITDGRFSSGRFGLFVNAGSPGDYTFHVLELSYWNLD